MKYIILENNIVKQIQLDDNYNLSNTEKMLEVKDNKQVVCGQIYDPKTKTFSNPVIEKTKEEIEREEKLKREQELIKKLGADDPINALAKSVNAILEDIASKYPESKSAKVLEIVKTTLKK